MGPVNDKINIYSLGHLILIPRLHDTAGCQTGCQTGLTTG